WSGAADWSCRTAGTATPPRSRALRRASAGIRRIVYRAVTADEPDRPGAAGTAESIGDGVAARRAPGRRPGALRHPAVRQVRARDLSDRGVGEVCPRVVIRQEFCQLLVVGEVFRERAGGEDGLGHLPLADLHVPEAEHCFGL